MTSFTFTTSRLVFILACQVLVYLYLSTNTKSSPKTGAVRTPQGNGAAESQLYEFVNSFRYIPEWIGNYMSSGDTTCDFGPSNSFQYMSLFGERKVCALDLAKEFVLNPTGVCPEGKLLDYVMIINSPIDNSARRRAIRYTYGKANLFGNMTARVVFLVGTHSDEDLTESVKSESKKYGDLVQGDFHDSFQNLTLKGISGLRWVANHCSNVKYVIKIDDDVFVNIFRVHNVVLKQMSQNSISCVINEEGLVGKFQKKDEWYKVPEGDFKFKDAEAIYPFDFCAGIFVIISGDLIRPLLQAAKTVPFYWKDDVYLYGMLVSVLKDVQVSPRNDFTQSLVDAQTCFRADVKDCTLSLFLNEEFDAMQSYLLWSLVSKINK